MSDLVASLSLDLDNKWAYLRAAGYPDWDQCAGFLPVAIDRVVAVLGELDLPLTVFLVGRDLDEPSSCDAIRSFDRLRRWEPANHSLNHLPWMHTLEPDQIAREIEVTDRRIEKLLGRRAVGFRGPGFSCPEEVLRVLARNDYVYDASVFPTSIAPLARAFFLLKTRLRGAERKKAKRLYGGFRSAAKPNRPFRREIAGRKVWEMPVTVMPFARTPIHLSYLLYLAGYSRGLAKAYFRSALRLCRITATPPSLLLHPTDFLGWEDDGQMAYFPGMKMSRDDKLSVVRWTLSELCRSFDVHCLIDQLRMLDSELPVAKRNKPGASLGVNEEKGAGLRNHNGPSGALHY